MTDKDKLENIKQWYEETISTLKDENDKVQKEFEAF